MSLDDRTLAIYRALDSATLLALLPALRHEAERTTVEAETFERVRQAVPEPHAGAEPLAREPVIRELEELRRARDRMPSADGELGRVMDRLDRYRAELLERERWILGELVRRGLLPEYPFWGDR